MSALRGEDGAIAGLEALAFGTLLFVTGTLLFTTAWSVIDAKVAVSAAAREATRAFVEAPAHVTVEQAHQRALEAADAALHGHGTAHPAAVDVTMEGARPGGELVRCARVTSTVTTQVPSVFLPFVGVVGRGGFEVRGTYTEVVDPFRAGLPAGGGCAV